MSNSEATKYNLFSFTAHDHCTVQYLDKGCESQKNIARFWQGHGQWVLWRREFWRPFSCFVRVQRGQRQNRPFSALLVNQAGQRMRLVQALSHRVEKTSVAQIGEASTFGYHDSRRIGSCKKDKIQFINIQVNMYEITDLLRLCWKKLSFSERHWQQNQGWKARQQAFSPPYSWRCWLPHEASCNCQCTALHRTRNKRSTSWCWAELSRLQLGCHCLYRSWHRCSASQILAPKETWLQVVLVFHFEKML